MNLTRTLLISMVWTLAAGTDNRRTSIPTWKRFPSGSYQQLSRATSVLVCDGEENLKNDIGILSFLFGGISSVAGLFSLTELSVPSNNITIISTVLSLILWVPSAILTFFAWSDPISWTTGNLVNLGSLIVTLYGGIGIITGTADILVSTMDEVLGITGLLLSSLTTFPEMYDELKVAIQDIYGREAVNNWIAGYGCGGSSSVIQYMRDTVSGM